MKFGGGNVMEWEAIKDDGTKILMIFPDRLNSNGYMDVLNKVMLPTYYRNDIFQQDNALCHKSRVVSSLSDWPPQSLDLNTIETLWFDLKGSAKCRLASIENLCGTCEDKWAQIFFRKNKEIV